MQLSKARCPLCHKIFVVSPNGCVSGGLEKIQVTKPHFAAGVLILFLIPYFVGGLCYEARENSLIEGLLTKIGNQAKKSFEGFLRITQTNNPQTNQAKLPRNNPPIKKVVNPQMKKILFSEIKELADTISRLQGNLRYEERNKKKFEGGALTPAVKEGIRRMEENIRAIKEEIKEKELLLEDKKKEYKKLFGEDFKE